MSIVYSKTSLRERWILAVLTVLALCICLDHTRRWLHGLPTDLRAFYAAGQVVDSHANPFTVEPLLSRETALLPSGATQAVVAPVPLPPYDLALLGAVAQLSVKAAAIVMGVLTIASGIVLAWVLSEFTRMSRYITISVAFMTVIYGASGLGQIAPIAIAALAAAAWALKVQRYTLAGVAVAVGMIQPQITIAAACSLMIFVPRARLALVLAALLALASSIALMGTSVFSLYIHTLAIHARAEVHFPAQYSLTWLLAAIGLPAVIAVTLGSLSTIVSLIASIVVLARHRTAALTNGAVIALPVAYSVIGGSFLHEHQLAAAILPAMLFLRPTNSWWNSDWAFAPLILPFAAMLSLEAKWPSGAADLSIVLAAMVCVALVYFRNAEFGAMFAARKALVVSFCGIFVLFVLAKLRPVLFFVPAMSHGGTNGNASLDWAVFCDEAGLAFHGPVFPLLVKIPIWAAVIAIAVCTTRNLEAS